MIEVLSRLRLPIAPEHPEEVARLADIIAAGGVGFFWIDYDDGNLYFVADAGVRNPFELVGDNLYYIMPEV